VCRVGTVSAVAGEQPKELRPHREALLDVLWVATVPPDDLLPNPHDLATDTMPFVVHPDSAHLERPVHGTLTVDVRSQRDRELLQRLLKGGRALSVTAADGWSQRVRLTSLRRVDTEIGDDGRHIVVATYTWVSAASFN
jgi:hypothetical protein